MTSDWLDSRIPPLPLVFGCNRRSLWYHSSLVAAGLETMRHSKYTSSPSLISVGSRVRPRDSARRGLYMTCTSQWSSTVLPGMLVL